MMSLLQTIRNGLRQGILAVFRCQYTSKQSWNTLNQIKVILTWPTSDLTGNLANLF